MKPFLAAFVFLLLLMQAGTADASSGIVAVQDVQACPATGALPPARFDAPGCLRTSIADLDPQGRDLWIQARINLPEISRSPLGLYVSAKASSDAYVNGVPIGANGVPAGSRKAETPGRMDAVFYIPDGLVHAGDNEIVVRLSSFHNSVHLSRPVHWIAVAPYDNPVDQILRAYWPSLVTFGVLVAGALFFASSAISAVNRRYPLLLSLLSLLAAGQLFAEVYRGLVPYAYPVHDWRLIAIAGFSAGFGVTLAALIVSRFVERRAWLVFAGMSLLTLTPLFVMQGFDGKAAYAILAASLACAIVAGRAWLKGDRAGGAACLALVAFAATILLLPDIFLNTLFYYEAAIALLVLFALRAATFERERRTHEQERLRAHDLELALARAAPAQDTVIRVNGAGTVNIIRTSDITLCKGADDYVELHLADGRTVLHNGALADLETDLPTTFLRVHRSFIVNTAFVEKLTRESTGVGVLMLTTGAQAPVSRRIMPKVRTALT